MQENSFLVSHFDFLLSLTKNWLHIYDFLLISLLNFLLEPNLIATGQSTLWYSTIGKLFMCTYHIICLFITFQFRPQPTRCIRGQVAIQQPTVTNYQQKEEFHWCYIYRVSQIFFPLNCHTI